MVNNPGKLDTITSYKGRDKIIVGNGQGLNISQRWKYFLEYKSWHFKIERCTCCSTIKCNRAQ